jgi:hypothetical protein
MKVKEVPFPEFKQSLHECIKNGDFTYDQVCDMSLFEFIAFLTEKLTEYTKQMEEWLRQHER